MWRNDGPRQHRGIDPLHPACLARMLPCSFHGKGIWGVYPDAILPGVHMVEGGQTSTGSAVAWFKRMVGEEGYATLDAEAAAVPPGSEGVVCLDHFQVRPGPHKRAGRQHAQVAPSAAMSAVPAWLRGRWPPGAARAQPRHPRHAARLPGLVAAARLSTTDGLCTCICRATARRTPTH